MAAASGSINTQITNAVVYMGSVDLSRRFFTLEVPVPMISADECIEDVMFTLGAVASDMDSMIDAQQLVLHVTLNGQSVFFQRIEVGKALLIGDIPLNLRGAHWHFVLIGRAPQMPRMRTSTDVADKCAFFAHLDYMSTKASQPTLRYANIELSETLPLVYDQLTATLFSPDSRSNMSYATARLPTPVVAGTVGTNANTNAPKPHEEQCRIGQGATAFLQSDGTAQLQLALPHYAGLVLQQARIEYCGDAKCIRATEPLRVHGLHSKTAVEQLVASKRFLATGEPQLLGYSVLNTSTDSDARIGVTFNSLGAFVNTFAELTSSAESGNGLLNCSLTYA
jgi:hypothetical protein